MALNKAALATSIVSIMNELKTYDGSAGKTQADAITKFANDLADAIDIYVKTGTVNSTVAFPIPVQVVPATGTGATTATGTAIGTMT